MQGVKRSRDGGTDDLAMMSRTAALSAAAEALLAAQQSIRNAADALIWAGNARVGKKQYGAAAWRGRKYGRGLTAS